MNQDPGPCLCLSGGGFRAMLFHLGALVRLNQLAVLARIKVITSVSGGSILNALLATRWDQLRPNPDGRFDNFDAVVQPVLDFAARDLRTTLLVTSRINPRHARDLARHPSAVPAQALADSYADWLQAKTLGQLPDPESHAPRFLFCATNTRTGACWQFHGGPRARMGDFYTGYFDARDVPLAQAVAASSAFPLMFSGLRLIPPGIPNRTDPWGRPREIASKADRMATHAPGQPILLADGGIYDNLGVEPVWDRCRTLLVSDAGHPFTTAAETAQAAYPRLTRAVDIAAEQVGAVRKRWMIERIRHGQWLEQLKAQMPDGYELPEPPAVRSGAIWSINTPPENFPQRPDHCYDADTVKLLARVRTDLNTFSDSEKMFLVNHGYWLADAGIRQRIPTLARLPDAPFQWPHPEAAPGGLSPEAALRLSGERRIFRDLARWVFHWVFPPSSPQKEAH